MSWDTIVIVACGTLVGLGTGLGARRFALLSGTAVVGSLVAWVAGPAVADGIAVLVGADTLLGAAAGRLLAYCAGVVAAAKVAAWKWPRPAGPLSRAARWRGGARWRGAALAILPAVALGWIVLGDLPRETGALSTVAAVAAGDESVGSIDLLRPVVVMRACRILCELNTAEAEGVASRAEVRAVVESPSLERLFRRPGLVREFAAAADGDWKALAKLAVDPTVKSAMNDPELLRRVRLVDVVALASDVEGQRRGGVMSLTSSLPAGAVAAAPLRLPAYAGDAELRRRIAAEWSGEEVAAEPMNAAPPNAGEQRARYWRQVEIGLGLLGVGARVLP